MFLTNTTIISLLAIMCLLWYLISLYENKPLKISLSLIKRNFEKLQKRKLYYTAAESECNLHYQRILLYICAKQITEYDSQKYTTPDKIEHYALFNQVSKIIKQCNTDKQLASIILGIYTALYTLYGIKPKVGILNLLTLHTEIINLDREPKLFKINGLNKTITELSQILYMMESNKFISNYDISLYESLKQGNTLIFEMLQKPVTEEDNIDIGADMFNNIKSQLPVVNEQTFIYDESKNYENAGNTSQQHK